MSGYTEVPIWTVRHPHRPLDEEKIKSLMDGDDADVNGTGSLHHPVQVYNRTGTVIDDGVHAERLEAKLRLGYVWIHVVTCTAAI